MPNRLSAYQEICQIVHHDLEQVVIKHAFDEDQVIDHFAQFLGSWAMQSSDPLVNGMNIIHSVSRYIMAIKMDKDNGISA